MRKLLMLALLIFNYDLLALGSSHHHNPGSSSDFVVLEKGGCQKEFKTEKVDASTYCIVRNFRTNEGACSADEGYIKYLSDQEALGFSLYAVSTVVQYEQVSRVVTVFRCKT